MDRSDFNQSALSIKEEIDLFSSEQEEVVTQARYFHHYESREMAFQKRKKKTESKNLIKYGPLSIKVIFSITQSTHNRSTYDQHTASTAGHLKKNLIITRKEKKTLQCSNCYCKAAKVSSSNRDITSMFEDLKLNEGKKSHKCRRCEYIKAKAGLSKEHVMDIRKEKRKSATSMFKYLKPKEAEKQVYRCTYCSYKTDTYALLRIHRMNSHTSERHKCKICPYRALTAYSLKMHQECIHKYVQCEHCVYVTTTNSLLIKHDMNLHKGKKHLNCLNPRCKVAKDSDLNVTSMLEDLKLN